MLMLKELEIIHKDELIALLKQGKINDSPTLSVVVPKQTVITAEENIQLMVVENKRPQFEVMENQIPWSAYVTRYFNFLFLNEKSFF